MLALLLFLFTTINCNKNILNNPSFEEFDSRNKSINWYFDPLAGLSSYSHSGSYSLHWNQINKAIYNGQRIEVEKDFKYEICLYFKLKNIAGNGIDNGFRFYISNGYYTPPFSDNHYSKLYYGTTDDWKKVCYITGKIKRPEGHSEKYIFGLYTTADNNTNGEVFVDDISIYRIDDFITIAINNNRDEVYDTVNVIYEIENKGNYTINDFYLITRIKDNNKIVYDNKIEHIKSTFFSNSININKLNLPNNKFYQIEAVLKSKKDEMTSSYTYTFKKINKIERKVTFDKYGRMFINNELFFPLGISGFYTEKDLMQINRTHFNLVSVSNDKSMRMMNFVNRTQNGKIKINYAINSYKINKTTCEVLNEEEGYKDLIDTINKVKDHPLLVSWYIADEMAYCFNKHIRNWTLTIHELDPDHPSIITINSTYDAEPLMNATDIMQTDKYPIGNHYYPFREAFDLHNSTYKSIIKSKPLRPVIQIFDWYIHRKNMGYKVHPPTLQEMRSMSWQGFVAGAKGLWFYSLYEIQMMNISGDTPFETRWKDVIEFTDQIWKYKDMILSVEEVHNIEYKENINVSFRQWKYNESNYIVIVNLERNKEIFEMNLLNKYKVIKEFGLGTFKQKDNNITLYLEPIDTIMIKYKLDNSDSSTFIVVIIVILFLIIIAIIILYIVRRIYFIKKEKEIKSIGKRLEPIIDKNI